MSCGLFFFSCCRSTSSITTTTPGVEYSSDPDLNSSSSAVGSDDVYFMDEENVISLRLRSSETLSKDAMDLDSDNSGVGPSDRAGGGRGQTSSCLRLFDFSGRGGGAAGAADVDASAAMAKKREKLVRKYTPQTINSIVREIHKLQERRDPHHLFRYPLGEDIKYISPFFLCRYQSCMVALNDVCVQLERWLGYYRLDKELKQLEAIHRNIAGDCYELSTPLSIAVNKIRPHVFTVVKHYHPKQGAIVNALMVACVSALGELHKHMASLDHLFSEPRSWMLSKRSHTI
jgi:hypothetical protein